MGRYFSSQSLHLKHRQAALRFHSHFQNTSNSTSKGFPVTMNLKILIGAAEQSNHRSKPSHQLNRSDAYRFRACRRRDESSPSSSSSRYSSGRSSSRSVSPDQKRPKQRCFHPQPWYTIVCWCLQAKKRLDRLCTTRGFSRAWWGAGELMVLIATEAIDNLKYVKR